MAKKATKKLRMSKAQQEAARKTVAKKSLTTRIAADKMKASRAKSGYVRGGRPGRKVHRSAKELGHTKKPLTAKEKAAYAEKGKGKGKFKKGNPGRQKGSTDKIPKSIKASVKAVIERIVQDPRGNASIESAIRRGIRGNPKYAHLYLKMAAEYTDGKPADTLNVNTQFKQEDLESAGKRIGAKLERMITTVLSRKRAREAAEEAASAVESKTSTQEGGEQSGNNRTM